MVASVPEFSNVTVSTQEQATSSPPSLPEPGCPGRRRTRSPSAGNVEPRVRALHRLDQHHCQLVLVPPEPGSQTHEAPGIVWIPGASTCLYLVGLVAASAAAAAASCAPVPILGLVDLHAPAPEIAPIERAHRVVSSARLVHFDECEAARATCVTIHDYVYGRDRAVAFERGAELVLSDGEREVPYVQLLGQSLFPFSPHQGCPGCACDELRPVRPSIGIQSPWTTPGSHANSGRPGTKGKLDGDRTGKSAGRQVSRKL